MGQNFSAEPIVAKETERAKNETFEVAVSSCQGWRMSQEDNHSLILDLPGDHKASFFAVFDGHGSARVSKHASEALWRHITDNESYKKGNFKEALEKAFLTFDREVNESYNAQLAGTTAICVLIVDNVILCANIGDSRAVASINCECVPLSHDHKPENPPELKRILAAGGYVLGNRVNGNLALSRAFGDFHYKGNDQLPPEEQIVSPCPDIELIELNDDVDFIVLACDGIWDVLTSEEVVKFVIAHLEQNVEPGLLCEKLTTRCLATDYELVIGCDNMTVLLICHTRGRSWADYCTDIFNKNTQRLGVANRTRIFDDSVLQQIEQQHHQNDGNNDSNSQDSSTSSFQDTDQAAPQATNQTLGGRFDAFVNYPDVTSVMDILNSIEHSISTTSHNTPPTTEFHETGDAATTKIVEVPSTSESVDLDIRNEPAEVSQPCHETDENPMSSNTTEIHLAAPDDGMDSCAVNEIDETSAGCVSKDLLTTESSPELSQENNELCSKTSELYLSSPDEEEQAQPIPETTDEDAS